MSETIFTVAKQEAEDAALNRITSERQRIGERVKKDFAQRRRDRLQRLARAEREYWNTEHGRRERRERRASDKVLNERIKSALAAGASTNDEFIRGDVSASCPTCHGRGLVANGRGHFGAGFFDDEGISQLPMREALCVCQHCYGSGRVLCQ